MEKNCQAKNSRKADEWYINESDKLSKMKEIRKTKNKIKKKKNTYMNLQHQKHL